jgi:hypothetical protein
MSPQNSATQATVPTPLSFSRAFVRAAKQRKKAYWRVEVLATVLAVGTSLVPSLRLAAALGVLSVAAKLGGKFVLAAAKKLFRTGERQRRYDFYGRTLGWPVPAIDRADMSIANASSEIKKNAEELAPREADYYAHNGSPGTEHLFCNLAQSMFFTDHLLGAMATTRWKHVALAATAVVVALIATIIAAPPAHGLVVLKYLGSVVTLLVALDVLGEAQSFGRGNKEVGRLLNALVTEMARATPSRDEALRLLIEYNCLLADLPMMPESIYGSHKDTLNAAWKEYEASLPFRCVSVASA